MVRGQLDNVMRHIGHLAAARQAGELPDRELLERFVTHHDQTAFAAIVERHGSLVLNLCRRNLRREQDAEDACQSTFLVLARKAGTIRKRDSLGSWLYGVASRVARNLATDVNRRACREVTEADVSLPDATGEISWREGLAVLDEELNRLPVTYRSALILCYLQGRTQDQAARELGCSSGALCGRLVRARECLRRRLVRRGVTLSTALLGTLLVAAHDAAALPPALAIRTVRAAAALLSGQALGRVVPASIATLTEGVMTAMFVNRVKTGAALALAASLLAAAGALAGAARGEKKTPAAVPAALALGPAAPPQGKPATPADKDALTVRGRVLNPDGRPVPGANLYLHASKLGKKGYVVRATTGDGGRFEFTVAKSELDRKPSDFKATALGGPVPEPFTGQVMAAAKGYGCAWATVGQAEVQRELTLRLVKDVPISGRIRDRDGKPVAGAKVRVGYVGAYPGEDLTKMLKAVGQKGWSRELDPVRYWVGALPGQPGVVTTAADGRFRLAGFGRERTIYLRVEGPAVESRSITVMTRAAEMVSGPHGRKVYGAAFDYLAAPSRPIRGVVRDKASGKPVAGATVYYDRSPPYWNGNISGQTDKEGRYELVGCPKSPNFTLCVVPPDGRHFGRQVRFDDDRSGFDPLVADIELPSGITVRGRVLDKASGKPVPGIRVSYYPLYENTYVVRQEEYPTSPHPLSSSLSGPDGAFAVAVLPGPGVLAAAAQPLPAYRPALVTPKELEAFLKDRPHRTNSLDILGVYPTGFPSLLRSPWLLYQPEHHVLALINPEEKDKTLVRDLVLLPPLTRQITVVGPDGKPLSGVTALSLDPREQDVTLKTATFMVRGLHPGRPRQMCFYHKEKNLGRALVLRGVQSEPLKVELQPCGSATGRFIDKAGKPVGGVSVGFRLMRGDSHILQRMGAKVKTDRDGRFHKEGLVPGQKYSMHRHRDGGMSNVSNVILDKLPDVIVKAGEKKELGDLTVTVEKP